MPLVTRAAKGSPLTWAEVDGNFLEHEERIGEKLSASDAVTVSPGAGDIQLTDVIVVVSPGSPVVTATRTMEEVQQLLIGDFLDYMDGML